MASPFLRHSTHVAARQDGHPDRFRPAEMVSGVVCRSPGDPRGAPACARHERFPPRRDLPASHSLFRQGAGCLGPCVCAVPGFLLVRSLVRRCRHGEIRALSRAILVRVVIPSAGISLSFVPVRLYTADRTPPYAWDTSVENRKDNTRDLYSIDGRHRGVTFSSHGPITAEMLDPVILNNIEWLVLVPYGCDASCSTDPVLSSPPASARWGGEHEACRDVPRRLGSCPCAPSCVLRH